MVRMGATQRVVFLRACFLAAALVCLFPISPVFAACQANDTATVTQVTQLNWSALQKPGGATTYIISGTGGADGGTGMHLYQTSARGQYNVVKDNNEGTPCTITIDIKNVVPGNANLAIGTWTGNYNGANLGAGPPWAGLALPGAGKTLFLGATATYQAAIPIGTLTPTFNIQITYAAGAPKLSGQTANIKFDTALSTTTNVGTIDYGAVKAGIAGATYAVSTTGVLTVGGGGMALYGTPAAASFNLIGSTTQTVVVGVSYSAANNGTTASLARCAYNGLAETACSTIGTVAAPGAGKIMLVGATVTSDGTAAAGVTATPTLTLSFTYT